MIGGRSARCSASAGLVLLVGIVVGAGCADSVVSGGRDLAIVLASDRTTAREGEEIEFSYEAEGMSLAGVVLLFGDGSVDSLPALGAQRAGARRSHPYEVAGQYLVTATVIDGNGDTLADSIVVQINP